MNEWMLPAINFSRLCFANVSITNQGISWWAYHRLIIHLNDKLRHSSLFIIQHLGCIVTFHVIRPNERVRERKRNGIWETLSLDRNLLFCHRHFHHEVNYSTSFQLRDSFDQMITDWRESLLPLREYLVSLISSFFCCLLPFNLFHHHCLLFFILISSSSIQGEKFNWERRKIRERRGERRKIRERREKERRRTSSCFLGLIPFQVKHPQVVDLTSKSASSSLTHSVSSALSLSISLSSYFHFFSLSHFSPLSHFFFSLSPHNLFSLVHR